MSLRLKMVMKNHLEDIGDPKTRETYESVMGDLINILAEVEDSGLQALIFDQASKFSTELASTGQEESLTKLIKLLDFVIIATSVPPEEFKEKSFNATYKQAFMDYLDSGKDCRDFADLVDTLYNRVRIGEIGELEIPTAHLYLKKILLLDKLNANPDEVPLIADILERLRVVIKFYYLLSDIVRDADLEEERHFRRVKHLDELDERLQEEWMAQFRQQQTMTDQLEALNTLLQGDQVTLLTKRIYSLTTELRELLDGIEELEAGTTPGDGDGSASEEMAVQLKTYLYKYRLAPEYKELCESLVKLNDHVVHTLIGGLNELIQRISAAKVKKLVLSEFDAAQAERAGVKFETILLKTIPDIPDMESFWETFVNYREERRKLLKEIQSLISKDTETALYKHVTEAMSQECKQNNPIIASIVSEMELTMLRNIVAKLRVGELLSDLDVALIGTMNRLMKIMLQLGNEVAKLDGALVRRLASFVVIRNFIPVLHEWYMERMDKFNVVGARDERIEVEARIADIQDMVMEAENIIASFPMELQVKVKTFPMPGSKADDSPTTGE